MIGLSVAQIEVTLIRCCQWVLAVYNNFGLILINIITLINGKP